MDVPLPWERLLWTGRPSVLRLPRAAGVRYVLTDFRLVRIGRGEADELALEDIGEVDCHQSLLDRLIGTSSIVVQPRARRSADPGHPIVLHAVRRGPQLAALLELLASDRHARLDADAVAAAMAWEPAGPAPAYREALAALALVIVAVFAVAIGLHGRTAMVTYSTDDAIYPNGRKRDREAIVRFMKEEVVPWARVTLAPIVGGSDRVRCEICHGRDAEERGWQMPGVAALPEPDVREQGWERYSGGMDAQMRNAIYGYAAESEKQTKAAHMREVVMPGMARLLHRQPYDFTKPYDYNRQRAAFGCYHCHKVR